MNIPLREESQAHARRALEATRLVDRQLSGRSPRPSPGDLFVLADTTEHPVEWLVIAEEHPELPQRVRVIPADLNPVLGLADIEVPATSVLGPLSLRPAFEVVIDAHCLLLGERTGILERQYLDAVLSKSTQAREIARFDRYPGRDGGPDPEYEDWVLTILRPAAESLSGRPISRVKRIDRVELPTHEEKLRSARPAPSEPVSSRINRLPPEPRRDWRFPATLAASILCLLIVFWLSNQVREARKGEGRALAVVANLEAELDRQGRRSRNVLAEQRRELEVEHFREIELLKGSQIAAAESSQETIATLRAKIRQMARPRILGNVTYASFFPTESRGGEKELVVPGSAGAVFLVFHLGEAPSPEYRLEILREPSGEIVAAQAGLKPLDSLELSLTVDRELLPEGEYRLRLYGLPGDEATPEAEYRLRVRGAGGVRH